MSNQLRWVILLLAAAVILPTVCLLWFMNQAIKNERLAVRSRLNSVYQSEVNRVLGPFIEWIDSEKTNAQIALAQDTPYKAFCELAEQDATFESDVLFIYDPETQTILYPTVLNDFDVFDVPPEL